MLFSITLERRVLSLTLNEVKSVKMRYLFVIDWVILSGIEFLPIMHGCSNYFQDTFRKIGSYLFMSLVGAEARGSQCGFSELKLHILICIQFYLPKRVIQINVKKRFYVILVSLYFCIIRTVSSIQDIINIWLNKNN